MSFLYKVGLRFNQRGVGFLLHCSCHYYTNKHFVSGMLVWWHTRSKAGKIIADFLSQLPLWQPLALKASQQEGSFHLSYNIAFLYSVTEVYGVFRKRVLLVSFFVVLSAHLTVPCLSNPRWPQTRSNPPFSASWDLGFKACAAMPSFKSCHFPSTSKPLPFPIIKRLKGWGDGSVEKTLASRHEDQNVHKIQADAATAYNPAHRRQGQRIPKASG